MLRVAFAGTPDFAVPTLRALAASSHTLVGVLTQPDRPAGRGRELKSSPIKQLAQQLQLPLAQPARLQSAQEQAALAGWQADVLVVVAYGLLLPRAALALPRRGCINVHASLLPRWRGAAPIPRAILAGDTESGITIMQMDAGLDTGPMLAQRRVPIDPQMNAQQLHDTLAQLGAMLLTHTLIEVEADQVRPQPQTDQGITYAAKISKAEALIDWQRSAVDIARQVRAFYGWPVAQTVWQGEQLRVWEAQPLAGDGSEGGGAAGAVLGLEHGQLMVRCGQGVLAITQLQLAGRRVVSARDFASAHSLTGARCG